MFDPIDWSSIFHIDTPLLEIFIRGTLVYLTLFIMLRCVLKRQAGGIGISDILVIVLIADASQNAMAHQYVSVPDGMLLVLTIIFWNYTLDWFGYHFPWFARIVEPTALPLVKNGRMMKANMRDELMTRNELFSQLRLQGVNELDEVKLACMESDGKLSVVTYETHKRPKTQKNANKKEKVGK